MRLTPLLAAILATSMTALAGAASVGPAHQEVTLRLLDTGATIDVFLDGGDPSHTGDREVFRDTLVWAEDRRPAGKAEGHCTVIEASTATTTCTIVTTLQRGVLTTEGVAVFLPGATSTGAVTGGTGDYEGATGHATFLFNPDGESPVTFFLHLPRIRR